jgi:cytochrome c-type protein NapB
MKRTIVLGLACLGLVGLSTGHAGQGIEASSMGLDKSSVFAVPSPRPFEYPQGFPGRNQQQTPAFPGAPPQIPHVISPFLPVTIDHNLCVRCHDRMNTGRSAESTATPMPVSHYIDERVAPDKVRQRIAGSRYICVQCHAPQANVKPLVGNTFAEQK